MDKKLFWGAVTAAVMLAGGCKRNELSPADIRRRLEGLDGRERYEALLELDQEADGSPLVKALLGDVLIRNGSFPEADIFLSSAKRLLSGKRAFSGSRDAMNREEKERLRINLAVSAIRGGRFPEAVEELGKGPFGSAELETLRLIRLGSALLASGELEAGLSVLDEGYSSGPGYFGPAEMEILVRARTGSGRHEGALEVLDASTLRHGFVPGRGLQEAHIHMMAGNEELSLLSLAMELEFRLGHEIPGPANEGNRDEGNTEIDSMIIMFSEMFGEMTDAPGRGLSAFFRNNFYEAYEQLYEYRSRGNIRHHFLDYMIDVSAFRMENRIMFRNDEPGGSLERPGREIFSSLLSRRNRFGKFPVYHYHLAAGLETRKGEEGLPAHDGRTAGEILRTIIFLSPRGLWAGEARIKLGGMAGLSPEEGSLLLIEPELRRIAELLFQGAHPSVLSPVVVMLGFPENEYSLGGEILLREVRTMPGVEGYLAAQLGEAQGRRRERLTAILRYGP